MWACWWIDKFQKLYINIKKMEQKTDSMSASASQNLDWFSVDGTLVSGSDACLPILDHALLYGDGVFDTVVVFEGSIYCYHDHYHRLLRSMKAIGIHEFFSDEDLRAWTSEAVHAQGIQTAYVKWIVTRGSNGTPLMDPTGCTPRLVVIVKPYVRRFNGSAPKGISLKTSAIRRVPTQCLDPKIKSLNYLNLIQAKLEAQASAMDEALMLDVSGNVCEAPGYNIFFVKGSILCTPGRDILEGITRQTVIDFARARSIRVRIGDFSLYDIYTSDEVFLTSTAGGMVPVKTVDGRTIGDGTPGSMFRTFAEDYGARLRNATFGVALEKKCFNSGEIQ